MKAQRATSARLAAGKKPALTSKTNTSTTSSTGSAASSSTKSSLLQQQQQPSSSSTTTTTPFLDLIDYTFSDNHLMIESNFNSYKLASATFGETGKGNTTTSEHQHKFICGREIGKGSYSKIYTIENTSSSENLSTSSLSSSTTTIPFSSSPPLALRLTSSNLMSRLDRENQILKIIHRAQQQSKSSSLINTNVVRVFGAGSLRPTDQQQKQNLYNGNANNNHQDVLNNNNHAFSAIHLIELLRSETLYQLMTQVGSAFTIVDVYEIMLGCAQAVNELHKLDIVHRDIKLDNFVFANNNNNNNTNTRHMIKLIDFGTAATVSPSTSTTNLPPEELNCGTPAYMSVEAARNVLGTSPTTKQQLTKAVDNWALGIIFYSLLTMSSPWKLEHKQQQQQSSSTTATRTASSRSNRGGGGHARGIMSLPPTPQGTADTKQQPQQQSQQQMSQSQIMMHRIVKCDWHWPPVDKQRHNANLNHITSKDAKQTVESLLQPDPSKRMTSDQLVLKLRQMISKEENHNTGTTSASGSSSRGGGVRSMTQNKENGGNSSMFGNSNNNNNTNRSGAIVRFLELKSNNSLTSTASYFQQQQQQQQQSSQSQQQPQPRQSLLLMMSKPPLPVSTASSSSSAPNNINDKLHQDAAAARTSNSTTAAVSASPQARKATLLIPPVLTEQEKEQEQEKPLPSRKSSSLSKKKSSSGNTTVVSPGVADNTDAAATTAPAPIPAVPLNKTDYSKLLKEYNKARKIITDEEKEAWEWIPYLHEANMKQAKHAHTFKKKVLKVDDDGEGFYCDQCSKLCTPPKDKKDLTKHKDEFCSMHCYGCDMDVCMECYDTYMSRRTCSHCQKKFSWLKDIAEHDCGGTGAAKKQESGKRRQRNGNDDDHDDENEKEETTTTKKTSTTRGGRRSQKVVGFVKSVDDDENDDDDALEQGDDGVTRTKNRKDDDDNNGPKKPFNDADANADKEEDDEEAAAARIEQTHLNSLPLVDQQRLPYSSSTSTRNTKSRRSRSKSAIDNNNNNEDAAAANTKRGRSSSTTTAANNKKGKQQQQQQRTLNWVRRVRRVENHPNSLVEDCFFYTITKGRHCAMFLSNDFPYHTVITAVQQGVAWFISKRRPNQQQQEDDASEEEFIVEKVNFEATRSLPLSDPKRRATETCKELAIEENTYNRNRRSLSACHDSIATSCFSSTEKDLADIRNAETLPIEFITDIRVEIMTNGSFKTNEDSSSSSFDEYNVDPSSSSYCLVLTLNDGRLQTLPGATQQQQQQQQNQKNNDATTSVLFTINNFELHGYQIEEEVEVTSESEQQEDSAMPPLTRKRNVVEYFDGGLAAAVSAPSDEEEELDGNYTNKKSSKKKKRGDLGFGGGIELKDDGHGGGNKSTTTSFERELTERAKKLGFRF